MMHTMRICRVPVFWVLVTGVISAQSFSHQYFSPALEEFVLLPLQEFNYMPVRLQGLGEAFHALVPDTLTDLFINPANAGHLSHTLALAHYHPVSSSTGFRGGSGGAFPASRSFLALGYWSPDFLNIGLPGGVFLRGSSSQDDNQNVIASTDVFRSLLQFRRREQITTRIADEFTGQLWLGVIQRPTFSVGLSYTFHYFQNAEDMTLSTMDSLISETNINTRHQTQLDRENIPWRGHQVSVGAAFRGGKWDILPWFRFTYWRSRFRVHSDATRLDTQVNPSTPDSIIFQVSQTDVTGGRGLRKITAWELGLDLHRGFTRIHLFGRVAAFTGEEFKDAASSRREILLNSVNSLHHSTEHREMRFDNTLWLVHGSLGRTVPLGRNSRLYAGVAVKHLVTPVSGALIFEGQVQDTTAYDTSAVQTSGQTPARSRFQETHVSFPLGLEVRRGIVEVRVGEVWNFTRGNTEIRQIDNIIQEETFQQDRTFRRTNRREFFGLGLHWKRYRLEISMQSELFRLETWNIAFSLWR